jgi:hypothetical protein
MKPLFSIVFVIAAILLAGSITGAEIGQPTWRLGHQTGNMRDVAVATATRGITYMTPLSRK